MGFWNARTPLEERINKIKAEFRDVKELDETIDRILSLQESEIYEELYGIVRTKTNKLLVNETLDDLFEFPQYKYATKILKKPPLYLPPFTDLIEAGHFIMTFSMIGFIIYTYKRKYKTPKDLKRNFQILERLMSSLNHFNTTKDYKVPDETYYKKLKQIKWNNQGKKLFKKLDDVKSKIMIDRGWGTASSTFETGEMFMLTFLAACNAVNHQRNTMLPEDVIMAYKTYLKLLNTDISRLEL